MTKLMVTGQRPLAGDVELGGDQQTIMAIQAASLLSTQGTVIVDNVPATVNIVAMNQLLQSLNVVINFDRRMNVLKMDATRHIEPVKISGRYLIAAGAILARCREVRLVDNDINPEYHQVMVRIGQLLKQLGADVTSTNKTITISATKLTGQNLDLRNDRLVTTLTLMMAATMTQGITVLNHPFQNPAVIELAKVLNKMGARVHGAGTDTIRIQGVTFLHSTDYYALDDQEEAGVYLALGALTAGDILVRGARQEHLQPLISHLEQMGNTVIVQHNGIRIIGTKLLLPVDVSLQLFQHAGDYVKIALAALQIHAQGTTTIEGFSSNKLDILRSVVADEQQQLHYEGQRLLINGPLKDYPETITTNLSVTGLLGLMNALATDQVTMISPAEVAGGSFVHLIDRLIELGAKIELSFD